MSEISFNCSKCGVEIETDESFAGSVAQCPNCNSTVMIPMPGIRPGMKVAGYEIISRLGAGGMGEVWLANQTAMGRKVALKILSPALTSDQDFVDRFLKEIQTAAKLEHTNIVTAFDAGVDGNIYYLAMSYVDGVILDDILSNDKRVPEKEALRIVRCIADALNYSWNKFQMLHRDIKPANIMLDPDRIPKLMDMGISKSLSEEKGVTMAGTILGTPYYMSPEQAQADEGIDCRADIYSLGATLYHLVTGEVPYDATTAMAILTKHINSPFPPPQDKNPELSDACAVLLEVMMAKHSENRPLNWAAAIEDIDLVLAGKFPKTKRPATNASLVMQQMTNNQALSRRKVFKQPQKAKLTNRGQKAGAGDQRTDDRGQITDDRTKNKSRTLIIGVVAAVLVLSVIIGGVVINNSKKAAAEKTRIEQVAKQKADDDKRKIAESAQKAELEKQQKAAESTAKLEKEQQELWDAAAKFANQALADKSNFETAIAGFEKIKTNCKDTKFEAMADTEIAKLAKAKSDLAEEQRKKADEEKRVSADAAKKAEETEKAGESTTEVVNSNEDHAKAVNSNGENSNGESVRTAVPSGDAVKAARAVLRQTFKDEFAKKSVEDKLAFSKSLRETAATEKDAVQKYALFVEAIALATDAGNTDEAFAAITELCAVFDAVSSKEKGIVLANFAKKTTKPDDFKILVDRYLTVVNEAMGDSDPVAASDLLKDCKPLATKAKDKALSSLLSDKAKEIAALSAEIKKLKPSMDKLKESPDDPDANFVVGRYECFVKGDWDKGLPMLAKSSDETLKSAVTLDLEATEPDQIAKAADAWWAAADKEKAPAAKVAMKAHASDLYGKAIANLSGIAKVTAEKRIAQSAAEAEASGIKLRSKQGGEYLIVDLSSRKLIYSAFAPVGLLTKDSFNTDKLVMRRVPAGDFMMGETNNGHKVKLTKDLYVGVFEVTQGQWEKVMKANPSVFKDVGKDAPVEQVSWEDCQNFMKELNGKKSSALAFRLPTESEWEYACRGGEKTSKGFEYSGSGILDEVAWFKDNSGGKTHPVGKKKPNELGLYDMSGNVWEWCSDWHGEYSKEIEKDPQGAKSGTVHILRGGGWGNDVGCCRSALRSGNAPAHRGSSVGFRLVLPAGQK